MDVLMPQLGETVAEGKITKWFVAPGAAVKPGDNLFEIETDKVSMEVPSITAGTLSEIRVQEGETAKVGAVVAVIAGEGGAAAPSQPAAAKSPAPPAPKPPQPAPFAPAKAGAQSQAPGPRLRGDDRGKSARDFAYENLDPFFEVRTPARNFGPAKTSGGATATPLARRLAAEGGIDLSRVKGSGPRGRIVAKDVEQAAAAKPAAPAVAAPAIAAFAAGPSAAQVKALYADTPYEELPLDNMRRTIARRLTEAKQTVPHFYLTTDVALDAVLKLREEANAAAAKGADGEPVFKLSVNDFVIK